MSGFLIFNAKDIDGRHWSFAQQNKGMSCGPTSVKIAKELYHNRTIGEEVIRGSVGLQHEGNANTGVGLIESARATEMRWQQLGSMEDMILPAVKLQPLAIPTARFTHGIDALRSASRNRPAILGFNWDGGGGHFVVCAGPTKKDPTKFVVLDPDGGLQYLSSADGAGNSIVYKPTYGATGRIDPTGFIITHA